MYLQPSRQQGSKEQHESVAGLMSIGKLKQPRYRIRENVLRRSIGPNIVGIVRLAPLSTLHEGKAAHGPGRIMLEKWQTIGAQQQTLCCASGTRECEKHCMLWFRQPCKICWWMLSRRAYRLRKLDPILQSSTFVQISALHMSRQRERQQCL